MKKNVRIEKLDHIEAEPRIGVYVCHCGLNIAQSLDIPQLAIQDISGQTV